MDEVLDFSANINPLGLPEWVRPLISSRVSSIVHYPDPDCTSLVEAISTRHGVPGEEVLVGNGSTEMLYLLPRVLKARRAVIPVPSYADYAVAAGVARLSVEKVFLHEEDGYALHLPALESRLQGDDLLQRRSNVPTHLFLF